MVLTERIDAALVKGARRTRLEPAYRLRSRSGSLAKFAAMRRASSRDKPFVTDRRCGCSSK